MRPLIRVEIKEMKKKKLNFTRQYVEILTVLDKYIIFGEYSILSY